MKFSAGSNRIVRFQRVNRGRGLVVGLAGLCAASLLTVALPVPATAATLGPGTLRVAACSPGVSDYVTQLSKVVSKAYERAGSPSAEPLMKKAIKVARKARNAAADETTKGLFTTFINVGVDKYRVSAMADALVALQDHVMGGC